MITSSISTETTKTMTNQTPFPTTTSTTSTTTTSTTTALTTTAAELNSSVLILNTLSPDNVPVLTDMNGNVKSINFEVENGVHVYQSCGVQFKGDYYVYGSSSDDKRQVAKITNCSLKRIGTLPFTFESGACAATMDQVFLCFANNGDQKTCHATNEPTGQFNVLAKSAYEHDKVRIATNNGNLLDLIKTTYKCLDVILACGALGGSYPPNNKCEVYKLNENKWQTIESYPFE